MNKLPIFTLMLVTMALVLVCCHKDKDLDNKEPVVSNSVVTATATSASFSWTVEFTGQFQTGVELSEHEDMTDLRRVEATKQEGEFVAVVENLKASTLYYYRVVVWNKFNSFEEEVLDFTTLEAPDPSQDTTYYTISVLCQPEEGGSLSGGGTFAEGDTCTITAVANAGYTFVNWTENGNQVSTEQEYTFTVTSDRNLVANFTSQEYTITATAEPEEGGTVRGSGGYNYGDECTLTATANEGYDFVNWTKNGEEVSTNRTYTFTVTESAEYVAHFQIQSYTISVAADPEDGGTVEGDGTYEYGQTCTVKATEANGFHFVNWTENGGQVSSNAEYTFTVNGNRSLMANFSAEDYIISVEIEPENGGTVTGAGGYNYGDECTLTATPNEGYDFTEWTQNGTQISTEQSISFTVTETASYKAHFTAKSYTIGVSAEPSDGGSVTGGGDYHYGEECTLTATANEGYDFDHWTKNGSTINGGATINFTVTETAEYVAHFQLKTYSISVSADPIEGGSVMGDGTYHHGEECTVTASANNGYTFANWTENGDIISDETNYSFTVNSNRVLIANFTQTHTVSVSASPSNGGTVAGGGTYDHGQNCTVYAMASNGYAFYNWTENGNEVSTSAYYTFAVNEDRTLVANFVVRYTVSVSANPSHGGSVSGGGNGFTYGQSCTLTANPAAGFTFNNWTENGNVVYSDATYTFTVTNNRTLVANFSVQSQAPPGTTNGLFSVSSNQQVWFSQGNLQYQASTNTWRFAESQLDCIGEGNNNISPTYDGWIDRFAWGTSGYDHGAVCYQPWSTSTTASHYYAYGQASYNLFDQSGQADWGYNAISNGGNTTNTWRTLSQNEWAYLLRDRITPSGIRFALVQITGVNGGAENGVIIVPDDWDASYYPLFEYNSGSGFFNHNQIPLTVWEAIFVPHGAVFLAPYVFDSEYGGYWSASSDNNAYSYGVTLSHNYYSPGTIFSYTERVVRYSRLCVRLVSPAN